MPTTCAPGESHRPKRIESLALVAATAMSESRTAALRILDSLGLKPKPCCHRLAKRRRLLDRRRKHLELADAGPHGDEALDLSRGLLARAENPQGPGIFSREILRGHGRGCADAQRRDGVIVHDAEELIGCHVPHQHETGEVAAELEPLAAVANRLGHVRGIDAQRDDVLTRQDAGDDVEHRPAFFIGWEIGLWMRRRGRTCAAASRYEASTSSMASAIGTRPRASSVVSTSVVAVTA